MSLNGTVWTPIGPSPMSEASTQDNGLVTAIAPHPYNQNIVYVGTAGGGVWRTRDGGTNWTPLFDRQLALGIGEPGGIAIDPNNTDQISSISRQTGFTLLELLVALSVLGLVLIALNQGVQTALGIWNVQSHQVTRTKDLDATARILRTVLTQIPVSASASSNPGLPPVAIAFTGKADQLAFVGNLPTGLGTDSYADITLGLSGKHLVLHWLPHRHELADRAPAANVTEILDGVERLDLAYWGPPLPAASPTWLAGWEGPSLPNLLRVRLNFSAGDPRHWPDLVIAPRL